MPANAMCFTYCRRLCTLCLLIAITFFRFGYDEEVFPGYSWRGYAVFSDIQKEIIHEVYIEKPSLYRMLMYYRNPSSRTIVGTIKITPDNPSDTEQVRQIVIIMIILLLM